MPQIITPDQPVGTYGNGGDLLKIPCVPVGYTASHTAEQADVGKVAYMNSGSANAFTILASGAMTTPFIAGQVLTVCQDNTGATTITAGAGVVFRIKPAATAVLSGIGAYAMCIYRGSNVWDIIGDLTAA